MTSDPDIYRAAKLLEAGDMVGVATWKAILRAIGELRRGRRQDEPLN